MKTIKVIDLLNKRRNDEELPKKFKYDDNVFIYDNEKNDYIYEHGNISFFCDYCNPIFNFADCLETFNKEVEIIEEERKTFTGTMFLKDGEVVWSYNTGEVAPFRTQNITIEKETKKVSVKTNNHNVKKIANKLNELIDAVNEIRQGN